MVGLQITRPNVRGHDHDRILEVHDAALAVGESAIIHDLQQDVEDVGMRFLDFVEKHYRVGMAADLLGELAAFFVADITRRRADQAGDRVLLHIFGHVDAQHGALVVKQKFRQSAGEFGFADSGGAEEDERADGALGIAESGAGAADRIRHAFESLHPGPPPAGAGGLPW